MAPPSVLVAAALAIASFSPAVLVQAAPAPRLSLRSPIVNATLSDDESVAIVSRQAITALSASQISSFKPFTFFASAAYCQPAVTKTWTCGANCNGNSDFIPTASGGDGSETQFWYVGFSPSQNAVIVAHQGTNPSEFEADLTDADFFLETLDSTLFPGLSSSLEVHNGFQASHARAAPSVLSAVQTTLASHPAAKTVIMTGHSLGGALALLDTVFLPLHISGVSFRTVTYGMPRVGNQAFANYVDAHSGLGLTHINNQEDLVPILPGRFLGFHHPSGEVHITDSNVWESCPGQDNTSDLCSTGDVGNIFEGSIDDHDGPYDGVEMGC